MEWETRREVQRSRTIRLYKRLSGAGEGFPGFPLFVPNRGAGGFGDVFHQFPLRFQAPESGLP